MVSMAFPAFPSTSGAFMEESLPMTFTSDLCPARSSPSQGVAPFVFFFCSSPGWLAPATRGAKKVSDAKKHRETRSTDSTSKTRQARLDKLSLSFPFFSFFVLPPSLSSHEINISLVSNETSSSRELGIFHGDAIVLQRGGGGRYARFSLRDISLLNRNETTQGEWEGRWMGGLINLKYPSRVALDVLFPAGKQSGSARPAYYNICLLSATLFGQRLRLQPRVSQFAVLTACLSGFHPRSNEIDFPFPLFWLFSLSQTRESFSSCCGKWRLNAELLDQPTILENDRTSIESVTIKLSFLGGDDDVAWICLHREARNYYSPAIKNLTFIWKTQELISASDFLLKTDCIGRWNSYYSQ